MDLATILRKRRMTRAYLSDPVPQDTIERVVGVVRHAPSAGNAQPHRLAVVTDAHARRRLADIAEAPYLERGFAPWISQAPAHIVVGVRESDYHDRYQAADKLRDGTEIPWPVPFWWFDSGALFMLLQLAAIDEGLGTGFYSPAPPDLLAAIADVAGFPHDVAVAGVVTIGFAGDEPPRPRRPRKPTEQLIHWV